MAGIGATVVAYFRFANRNLPFAIVVGVLIAGMVFVLTFTRARDLRTHAVQVSETRTSRPLAPLSSYNVFTGLVAIVLAILAAVYASWSLLLSATIFAALTAALVVLRHRGARRGG